MAAGAGRAARVERQGEDRWRIWPTDETWLPAVTAGAMAGMEDVCAAVIKEHPQHEGVLLQGPLPELLRSADALCARLRAFVGSPVPVRAPDFAIAVLLRRAIMTRPVCLAVVEVAFTENVESCEAEPLVAHRLGQLAFRVVSPQALRVHEDVPLLTPPGEEALAAHLRLPEGVALVPELARVKLGVKAAQTTAGAAASAEPPPIALLRLAPGSVRTHGHAKFMGVTSVACWPAWRLQDVASDAERTRALGFEVSEEGVVLGRARREFLAQAGVRLHEQPQFIELDFEAISFTSREAVLDEACRCLVAEIEEVVAQLPQPVHAGPSECPDVPRAGSVICADRA